MERTEAQKETDKKDFEEMYNQMIKKKQEQSRKAYLKVKEKKKAQYEAKKQHFNCECGAKILVSGKANHLISKKHKTMLAKKQEEEKTKLCLHCNKPLVAIGTNRKNGAPHGDWDTRKYHKKCWADVKYEKELKQKIQANLDPNQTETSDINE